MTNMLMMLMMMQEYISTTLPMMVNSLMQLVSAVIQKLICENNADDAHSAKTDNVTVQKFTVRTKL